MIIIDQPKMHTCGSGCSHRIRRPARYFGHHGVEEGIMDYPDPGCHKITCKLDGRLMNGVCDLTQPVRPVVNRVHAGCNGEQHLRGTDVRGRLLAADVLLSSLQCQAEARCAVTILGNSDEPAG